jgi:hypothetical protein
VDAHCGVDAVEDDDGGVPGGEVFGEVAAGGVVEGEGFVGADVGDVVADLLVGESEGLEAGGDSAVGVFEVEDGGVVAGVDGLGYGVEGDPRFPGFGGCDESVDASWVEEVLAVVSFEDRRAGFVVVGIKGVVGVAGPPGRTVRLFVLRRVSS